MLTVFVFAYCAHLYFCKHLFWSNGLFIICRGGPKKNGWVSRTCI